MLKTTSTTEVPQEEVFFMFPGEKHVFVRQHCRATTALEEKQKRLPVNTAVL